MDQNQESKRRHFTANEKLAAVKRVLIGNLENALSGAGREQAEQANRAETLAAWYAAREAK